MLNPHIKRDQRILVDHARRSFHLERRTWLYICSRCNLKINNFNDLLGVRRINASNFFSNIHAIDIICRKRANAGVADLVRESEDVLTFVEAGRYIDRSTMIVTHGVKIHRVKLITKKPVRFIYWFDAWKALGLIKLANSIREQPLWRWRLEQKITLAQAAIRFDVAVGDYIGWEAGAHISAPVSVIVEIVGTETFVEIVRWYERYRVNPTSPVL